MTDQEKSECQRARELGAGMIEYRNQITDQDIISAEFAAMLRKAELPQTRRLVVAFLYGAGQAAPMTVANRKAVR